MTEKATSTNGLRDEWNIYDLSVAKIQDEIVHLNAEIERAQIRVNAEEQAIVKNPFRTTDKAEDKNHILHAARKISARAQRRLDRLHKRIDDWDRNECSPTIELLEMHERSLMDILKEIKTSLEDEMVEAEKIINAEEAVAS